MRMFFRCTAEAAGSPHAGPPAHLDSSFWKPRQSVTTGCLLRPFRRFSEGLGFASFSLPRTRLGVGIAGRAQHRRQQAFDSQQGQGFELCV